MVDTDGVHRGEESQVTSASRRASSTIGRPPPPAELPLMVPEEPPAPDMAPPLPPVAFVPAVPPLPAVPPRPALPPVPALFDPPAPAPLGSSRCSCLAPHAASTIAHRTTTLVRPPVLPIM